MASGPLGAIPPALKKVTPFMKRAEEVGGSLCCWGCYGWCVWVSCVCLNGTSPRTPTRKTPPYTQLDKDTVHPESKAVAYYCRAYAMDQAMLLRDASNQKEVG